MITLAAKSASRRAMLEAAGVAFRLNPRLVRGLDYYNKTVFEWTTDRLGAQSTICAGGRYDGLVEQLGGKPTPAVGFAMGIERLVLLLETLDLIPEDAKFSTDVFVISMGDDAEIASFVLAETLREEHSDLVILRHCGGGNFKNQMKKADKSDARFTIILGQDEVEQGICQVKDMSTGEQKALPFDDVAAFQTAFGPHAKDFAADVKNYSNVDGQLQISNLITF